jgi:hypothetical protein
MGVNGLIKHSFALPFDNRVSTWLEKNLPLIRGHEDCHPGGVSDGLTIGCSGTFNLMLEFPADGNILRHLLPILGMAAHGYY